MRQNKPYKRSIRGKRFIVLAALVLLVSTGWWYVKTEQPTMLPIENVRLEGHLQQLSADEVRETIASVLRGGYFTVDLAVIRQALLELPWVQDVSIRRQWPLGLYIKVQEKTAVARWGDTALISDQGAVFSPAQALDNQSLPILSGPENLHGKVITFYNELNRQFATHGFSVKNLSLDERRAWTLTLSNNVAVKLGREDVAARLSRLNRVLSMHQQLDMHRVAIIDMRYTNGFAMRLQKTNALVTEV